VYTGTIAAHCKECAGEHLALVARRVARLGESVEGADAKVMAMGTALGHMAGGSLRTSTRPTLILPFLLVSDSVLRAYRKHALHRQ